MREAETRMNSTKPETQAPNRADTFKLLAAGTLILGALAAFYIFANFSLLARVIGLLAAAGAAVAIALKTEPGAETLEFIRGARSELRKVVWPTRAETTQTTLIVIAMVVIMGLLLWLFDILLLWLVRLVTG
jgi:preprotein translocase subunit SecE